MALMTSKIWRDPRYFIGLGFGSGLLPVAPGTWGTLAAIPVYALLVRFGWVWYALLTGVAFLLGVYVCDWVSRDLGTHDDSRLVWDEIVGYLITMFLAPPGIMWIALGFVLFRLFDVWKPQPIRWVDARVLGGLGIMLDDVLAALLAFGVLQGIARML